MTIDNLLDNPDDIKAPAEFPEDDKNPINYSENDINRLANTYAAAKQILNPDMQINPSDLDFAKSDIMNNGINPLRTKIDVDYKMFTDRYLSGQLDKAIEAGNQGEALDIISKGQSLNIPDEFALEKQGVANLALMGSVDNTGTPDNTISKNVRDFIIKREIMSNELAKIKAEEAISAQEEGVLNLVNYGAMLVPFNKQTMVAEGLDTLTPGTKLLKDYADVMNTPLENGQFVSKLRDKIADWRKHSGLIHGENLPLVASQLQDWVNYDSSNKFADNVWSAIDVATMLPVGMGGKGAVLTKEAMLATSAAKRAVILGTERVDNSALGILRQTGNTGLASKSVADTIVTLQPNTVVRSEEEALRAALPFRTSDTPTDNLATQVNDQILKTRLSEATLTRETALNEVLLKHNPTATLTNEELQSAIDRSVAAYTADVKITQKPVAAIDIDPISLAPRLNLDFFNAEGKPFANEIAATEYANTVGLKDYKLIETPTKGFAIRVENIINPSDYINDIKIPQTEEIGATIRSGMRRWMQQPRGNVPNVTQSAATEGVLEGSSIKRVINQIYNRDLKSLSLEQQRKLSILANEVRDIEKWGDTRSIQDLYQTKFGAPMSDKEINAWHAYVDINDFDWHMANSSLYKTMVAKGYMSANIPGHELDHIIGKKIDSYIDMKAPIIYDLENQTYRRLGSEEFSVYKDKGMQFFEVHDPIQIQGQRPLYIMGKSGQMDIEQLPRVVLPYKEGGRVQYATGSVFLKQEVTHTLNLGTDKVSFSVSPRTLYVEKNLLKARAKVSNINDSIRAYKELDKALKEGKATKDLLEQTNSIIAKAGRYGSFKEMQQAIRAGDMNLEPLRIYTNRSSVPLTIKNGKFALDTEAQSGIRLGDEEPRIQSLFADMRGKMAPRGLRKLSADETPAELKSPFETIEESLNQSINSFALAEFKITEPLRWLKTYKPYLEGFGPSDNPVTILSKAQFKPGTPWAVVNAGEQLRDYIKNILKIRTAKQATNEIDMLNRQLRIEGSLGNNQIAKVLNHKWMDFKPGEFFRTLNYHATLGMFNPTQFLLQSTSALYTFTLKAFEPLLALRSMKTYLLLNRAMIRGTVEDVAYMNQLGKSIDKSIPSIKVMYDDLVHSGFLEINATHTLKDTELASPELFDVVDSNLARTYLRKAQRVAGKALNASSVFFAAGERQGRIAAWAVAYNEALDKGIMRANMPAAERLRAVGWIKNEADRLSFGQTRANQMWLQMSNDDFFGNVKSLMFQYFQFAWKLFDAQTTSKAYTVKEKVGALLGSLLLLGSESIPFAGDLKRLLYEELFTNGKTDMTWDQFDQMTKGALDAALSAATGEDVRFGENATVGGMIQNNLIKMADGSISPIEVLGGAAYNRASRVFKEFVLGQKMYENVNGRPVENLNEKTLNILASAISSINIAKRTYTEIQTGKMFAKDGTPLIEISPKAALLNAGGIITAHYNKVYKQIQFTKDLGNEQKDAVKVGQRLFSQYMQALAASHYDDAEAFLDAYNLNLQAYPLSQRRAIDQKVKDSLRKDDSFIRNEQILQDLLLKKRILKQNQANQ